LGQRVLPRFDTGFLPLTDSDRGLAFADTKFQQLKEAKQNL
jgi:hypothetical protein